MPPELEVACAGTPRAGSISREGVLFPSGCVHPRGGQLDDLQQVRDQLPSFFASFLLSNLPDSLFLGLSGFFDSLRGDERNIFFVLNPILELLDIEAESTNFLQHEVCKNALGFVFSKGINLKN